MTGHHAGTPHATLVEDVARVVEDVAGVAFLRPGLADRLRSALSRPAPRSGRTPSAGVRMTREDGAGSWHVEIEVVVLRQARPVDVARAVRARVENRLDALAPERPATRVTVTVTGRV
ncbi:hypothetical protein [Streptomyces sp. NPDC088766]|uniref:hypothetical protein n=1 Tax=Streptomyces sp. NPDC088766 TaxID=3365893 RepID=UPI0038240E2C